MVKDSNTWVYGIHACIYVLQKRGMDEELITYDEKCKSYENDKNLSKFMILTL